MNTPIPEEAMGRMRAAARELGNASHEVMSLISGPSSVMYEDLSLALEKEKKCAAELDAAWNDLRSSYQA